MAKRLGRHYSRNGQYGDITTLAGIRTAISQPSLSASEWATNQSLLPDSSSVLAEEAEKYFEVECMCLHI